MSDHRPSLLERAFEIADAGRVSSINDIRSQLQSEGYSAMNIQGPVLMKQLAARIAAAKLSNK